MRFQKFSFGSIRIDGTTYEHDVVIDRGEVRKRKKRLSNKFREAFGHTPISPKGSSCTKGYALRLGHATATNGICSEVQSIMYESASPLYFCGATTNACDASGINIVYPGAVGYCSTSYFPAQKCLTNAFVFS